MIDFNSESLISFQEATQHAPGEPHISTLHRWRLRGIRGVRLETCLIGGKRFTTKEALDRFFESVTTVAEGNRTNQKTISERRQKQIDSAEQALEQRLRK
jgi:hypothetical protein